MRYNRNLKENGRIFKVIKPKRYDYDTWFNEVAWPQIGDIYKECIDGWYLNIRNDCRSNIMNMDDKDKYFKEIDNE